jgi:hypothetical protein
MAMKFVTRIPTHDNQGRKFGRALLRRIYSRIRDTFGGYSLDGPGLGAWTDSDGTVYQEQSYVLTIVADRSRRDEVRQMIRDIGRELGQLAMYYEEADGAEILDVD